MSDKREASNQVDLYAQMDKAAVRTAADVEQKYNIGKSFAEVTGIAEDARANAEKAKQTAESVDSKLDQEELFKRLTNNNTMAGLEQGAGNYYCFNGAYINNLHKMFERTIVMTGVPVVLYPGEPEAEALREHLSGGAPIPEEFQEYYDFNGDADLSEIDLDLLQEAMLGNYDYPESMYETEVRVAINFANPEKFITVSGVNKWGRAVEMYIGVNSTNIRNLDTERKINELEQRISALENV